MAHRVQQAGLAPSGTVGPVRAPSTHLLSPAQLLPSTCAAVRETLLGLGGADHTNAVGAYQLLLPVLQDAAAHGDGGAAELARAVHALLDDASGRSPGNCEAVRLTAERFCQDVSGPPGERQRPGGRLPC